MTLSIIVAITDDFAIGKNNDLLLRIPGDLPRFKNITTGNTVIMGRKTLLSLPGGKPLPNRRNIVLSTDKYFEIENCEIVHSIEEMKALLKDENEVFVIGGGKIYEQIYPIADKLYLTIAHTKADADTYFPTINFDEWTEVSREDIAAGEKADFGFSFVEYVRKIN